MVDEDGSVSDLHTCTRELTVGDWGRVRIHKYSWCLQISAHKYGGRGRGRMY